MAATDKPRMHEWIKKKYVICFVFFLFFFTFKEWSASNEVSVHLTAPRKRQKSPRYRAGKLFATSIVQAPSKRVVAVHT